MIGDPVQPTFERSQSFELGQHPIGLDQDILAEILRILTILQQGQGQREYHILMKVNQATISLQVSLGSRTDPILFLITSHIRV